MPELHCGRPQISEKRPAGVSGAAAIIGNVLGIHPILVGDYEGKIVVKSKVRGMKRTLAALAERLRELALSKTETIGIAHADNEGGQGISRAAPA